MKRLLTFHFLSIYFFLLISTNLFAQELSDDGAVHQIDFSGSVEDYIIPTDITYDRIEFLLDGGDGGKGSDCNIKGGKGAQVTAAFEIAPFGISLRPGGTIRFIVGEKGKNRTGNNVAGSAGGGGGTAILYKHPGASTDNVPSTNLASAGSDWVILAVAGGGGGAYQRRNSLGDCGSNSKKGQGGRTGTSGGGFGINPGGTNGSGGTGISGLGGAGGGYLSPGVAQSGLFNNDDGKEGGTHGGEGGYFNFNGAPSGNGTGGYGYGGGGAGQSGNESSGGGGGGYSGGAGGLEGNRQGFGGGSFVNSDDIAAFRSIVGDQHIGNPKSGYITYKFFNSNGLIARCKDVTVQLDASNTATFLPDEADDGSYTTDESIILDIYAFPASTPGAVAGFFNFDCTDLGEHEYVLVVVPSPGSIGYCSFNLTVEDHAPPIAQCKNIVAELNGFSVNISPGSVDDGSFDACSSHVLTLNNQTFNCLNIGNNIVELTIRDENDNTATCTATVTVTDTGLPQANCGIFPLIVQLDDSGMQNISIDQVLLFDSDNCNVASRSLSKSSFDCSDIGENIVTATVTDQSGNTGTCSATVTIINDSPPVALCQNTTIFVDDQGQVSLQAADVDAGSSQSCDPLTLSTSPTDFDCSDLGNHQVTLTVTDQNNNQSTCTATVRVEDNIPPVAICRDRTLQLNSGGVAVVFRPFLFSSSSYDNCGTINIHNRNSPITFNCQNLGENYVNLTINDGNGSSSSCISTVIVEDNVAPTPICEPATLQLDENGMVSLEPNVIMFRRNEKCFVQSETVSPSEFNCNDIGENEVTLSITDQSGNIGTCSATVMVLDETPPVALCQDRTINVNDIVVVLPGVPPPPVVIDNGSYDNCGDVSLSFTTEDGSPISIFDGELRFPCNYIGVNTVILTASDGNLSSTCSASLTVVDNVPPSTVCDPDVEVQLDDTGIGILLSDDIVKQTADLCGTQSIALSQNQFDCDDIGIQLVTATVTDNSGNTTTCLASVTVEDNSPPDAVCQDLTLTLDESGTGSIEASSVNGSSSDGCGVQSFGISQEDFNCSDLGINTIILTVTDLSGNSSTCSAELTVIDLIAPTVTCQDVTVQLDDFGEGTITAEEVKLTAEDICGTIVSLELSQPDFQCDDVGANAVILTATDDAGNIGTCSANVLVEDNIPPTISCFNPTVTFNGESIIPIAFDQLWDEASSIDNCGINAPPPTPGFFTVSCDQIGEVVSKNIILTDINGNIDICTANITVQGLPCGFQSEQINCIESTQAGYDPTTGTYNLSAENCYDPNYYSNNDVQNMIQQELCGDGEIIVHVADIDGDAWAGILMRENNDPDAKMLQLAVSNAGLAQRKLRATTGGYAFNHVFQNQGKYWLRLTRAGNQFGAYLSLDGSNWDAVFLTNIPMSNCILTGLFISNTTPGTMATTWFDQVQIKPPVGNALQTPNGQLPIANDLMTNDQSPNNLTLKSPPDFQVYPNPTDGKIHIVLDEFMDQPIQILLYNQQGQVVLNKELIKYHAPKEQIGLQGLKDGLYFIQLRTKEHYISKKLSLIR